MRQRLKLGRRVDLVEEVATLSPGKRVDLETVRQTRERFASNINHAVTVREILLPNGEPKGTMYFDVNDAEELLAVLPSITGLMRMFDLMADELKILEQSGVRNGAPQRERGAAAEIT